MKSLNNQKGITIISLILAVILMLILVGVSIRFGTEAVDKSIEEDIKNNMLLIQGKCKIIKDKNDFESTGLLGIPANEASGYKIEFDLPNKKNAYILTQEDLNNNGLGNIITSNTEFYVVDYDTCEVYYSLGINGKYALSEM